MRYIVKTRRLETDDGELIKVFECPLEKRWEDLMPWTEDWQDEHPNDHKRLCGACRKCVVNFQPFSESQILAITQVDPNVCGHLRTDHPDMTEVVGLPADSDWGEGLLDQSSCVKTQRLASGERIIRTARSLQALRAAVNQGLIPYFVPNMESGRTQQKLSIVFDREKGRLSISGHFRSGGPFDQQQIELRYGKGAGIALRQDFRRHSSPVAAYLLPHDIAVEERVYLEDLIEDRVASIWYQGDAYRASTGFAIWRGHELEIERSEDATGFEILG
jgi:hypothetical protein